MRLRSVARSMAFQHQSALRGPAMQRRFKPFPSSRSMVFVSLDVAARRSTLMNKAVVLRMNLSRSSVAVTFGRRCATELDDGRFCSSYGAGQRGSHCHPSVPRRTRYSAQLGKHSATELRGLYALPRNSRIQVIALRDLTQYVGTDVEPPEPMAVIEKRKQQLER